VDNQSLHSLEQEDKVALADELSESHRFQQAMEQDLEAAKMGDPLRFQAQVE